MKKKALLKMIDTYIMDLKEIRKDVNSMIADDEVEEVLTYDETIEKIIKLLSNTKDIESSLEDLKYRLQLKNMYKDKSSKLTIEDFEYILNKSGINTFKKAVYDSYKVIAVYYNSGSYTSANYGLKLYFDGKDELYKVAWT